MAPGREPGPRRSSGWELGLGFSPDGDILAAGDGPAIVLWDLKGLGDFAAELAGLGRPLARDLGYVRSLAWSPDGSVLAADSIVGKIWLLDAETGESVGEPLPGYLGESGSESVVVFSPDGSSVAIFGAEGEVRKLRHWDLATRSLVVPPIEKRKVEKTGCLARAMAFTADRRIVAVDSDGGRVERWEVISAEAQSQEAQDVEGTSCVTSLTVSPDGNTVAVGANEGTVMLLGTTNLEPRGRFETKSEMVSSLAFSPDGLTLAAGHIDGTVRLWDLSASSPRSRPPPRPHRLCLGSRLRSRRPSPGFRRQYGRNRAALGRYNRNPLRWVAARPWLAEGPGLGSRRP